MSQSTEADKLKGRPACPFCGSTSLRIVLWADDDGEYDAVECNHCKAGAPLDVWDRRTRMIQAGKPLPILKPGIDQRRFFILSELDHYDPAEAKEAKRFFSSFKGGFTPGYGIRKP